MNNIEQHTINGTKVLCRPATNTDQSAVSMVILHGYGADEYDLMGLAPYFDEKIQVISIRGPGSTVYGGASWFDIDMLADGSLKFNIEQAKQSTELVLGLIEQMQTDGMIQAEQIILGGFSQGATVSNLITLRKPELIKALLIMSGRLPDQVAELIESPAQFAALPIFAGHGINDNVIPIEFGRQIVTFWNKLAILEHHEYPMGHEISQAELQHIQVWLDSVTQTD
mgnify:CR=1 FL=1